MIGVAHFQTQGAVMRASQAGRIAATVALTVVGVMVLATALYDHSPRVRAVVERWWRVTRRPLSSGDG